MTTSEPIPIPIHLGIANPGQPPAFGGRPRPRTFAHADVDWAKHGLTPRWLGDESGDCVAALEPNIFTNYGGTEWNRFLEGARSRGETALMIATIGFTPDEGEAGEVRRVAANRIFSSADSSVYVDADDHTSVAGLRLPAQGQVELADGVPDADRDLGTRLLSATRPDSPWWRLSLVGTTEYRGSGGPAAHRPPTGTLCPILVDGLGDPVVAVWVSPEEDRRFYIVPDQADGDLILGWLLAHALPAYVPGALRRARRALMADPSLRTSAETSAMQALNELDARYAADRARIEHELAAATEIAEPIRRSLLYGAGDELEDAVAAALRAAGFDVVDLDERFGPRSADFLATYGSERRLIEVKSAAKNARETFVGDLVRHQSTWPNLNDGDPAPAGVLVVNHQHGRHPSERSANVFERAEFRASLTVNVLSSKDLYTWWAAGDFDVIRSAVLETRDETLVVPTDVAVPEAVPRRFFRRRRNGS